MVYAIQAGDDPNVIDHIFSEAAGSREMLISYGDWSQPSHIYKEEKALITNLTQNYSFSNSTITYNIAAVSVAVSLMSQSFNFPSVVDKPSNIIKRLLQNNKYKLREVFKGMGSMSKVVQNNLLETDDRVVKLEDKPMTNVLDYLIYLVQCMQPQGTDDGYYALSVSDDARSYMGGAYFVVKKIDIASWEEEDAYELDIGFPGNNLVSSFDVQTNNQWTILYENSAESDLKSTFKIDQNGVLVEEPSLSVTRDKEKLVTTQLDTMWWKKVTEFPIQATVTIKGLARPSILLQYVKLNVQFYGKRSIISGRYIVIKQVDVVDSNGYKTTLDLLKIKGDFISPDMRSFYNNGVMR